MKSIQRQLGEHTGRRSTWGGRVIGAAVALLLGALAAPAQTDAVLPPLGGTGGSQFVARCPQGRHLAGFELLVGDDVDAIRPLCVPAYGPADAGQIEPYPSSFGGPERDAMASKILGRLEKRQVVCPRDAPVVTALKVGWEGIDTLKVNNLHLFCGQVAAAQRPSEFPSAVYDGPAYTGGGGFFSTFSEDGNEKQRCPDGLVAVGINGRSGIWLDSVGLICGPPHLTKVVRAGGRIKPDPNVVRMGGRVKMTPAPQPSTNNGALEELRKVSDEIRCRGYAHPGGKEFVFFTINSRPSPTGENIVTYEMAFTPSYGAAGLKGEGLRPGECAWVDRPIGDAGPLRVRFETVANAQLKQKLHGNRVDTSPTAAESYPDVNSIPRYLKVESHYWSFGGVTNSGKGYFQATGNSHWRPTPVRAGGRMPLPPTGEARRPICEIAREARARNSPAAPGLEAQCRAAGEAPAFDVGALAAKGEVITSQDPLAAELLEQQPGDASRWGFYVGMGAAAGQTAPGLGKDRIRDSLNADERPGFVAAVAFSLERNKYAARAELGARIAASDDAVAAARNAEADVFYRLGFDIATAMFGDPKLGAQGNTAMGPGSMGIRNSLSASGQRGFDAAVKLHLGRNYKR